MAITTEPDVRVVDGRGAEDDPPVRRPALLTVAAVAALSAGAVHAAAIGAHAEHPGAARMFVGVALFQLGWGAVALARRGRAIAFIGAAGNAALLAGWVLAKWKGLSFVPGLDEAEPIQFADALCAALAALSALTAAAVFTGYRIPIRRGQPFLAGAVVTVLALIALPGMVEAGNHVHNDGGGAIIVVRGKAKKVTTAVVPPKPYDPAKPIDLGGVKGVTLGEQARAENLIAETVVRLPQWADPAHAEKFGFRSIGDGITGIEHLVNWSYIGDGNTLDPDRPESLVYRVEGQKRTLVSAMYMLKPGATLNKVPDIGGPLTQWHIHDNLCFTGDKGAFRVAGLTDGSGNCAAPLVKLQPVPMIHVWIVPHPCGPFAALEGVGAGQVKPGETKSCDHAHGSADGGL